MKTKKILKNKSLVFCILMTLVSLVFSILIVSLLGSLSNITNLLLSFSSGGGILAQVFKSNLIPVFELIFGLIGLLIYLEIDYKQHRNALIYEDINLEYSLTHHIKVVTIPKTKYYWKPLTYWSGLFASCIFIFALTSYIFGQSVFAYSPNEFVMTWKTDNPGISNSDQITLLTTGGGYNYDVDWGDSSSSTGLTGDSTHTYALSGTYTITITGTFPRIYCNGSAECQKLLNIEHWGNNPWTSMANAFEGAINLNINATDSPNLSAVTSMNKMFKSASNLNSNLNNWDVSGVTDMCYLFYDASSFNQPLDNWDVSGVTDMCFMFLNATSFNRPLNSWNVSNVKNMLYTFYGDINFNQPLDSWDVSNVTNTAAMFGNASNFNFPLNNWNTSKVTTSYSMFSGATSFNQPLDNWDVSKITDMSHMFDGATSFNHPLDNWDVSSVDNMTYMFYGASNFNQTLNTWNVSNVSNLVAIFRNASSFNQPLNSWNVSNVSAASFAFDGATSFNQPLDNWDVSGVTDMSFMFNNTSDFNQPLDTWNVSNVNSMPYMFGGTNSFNQPLDNWDVSKVNDMSGMFRGTSSFNQPLNSWNVSGVTTLYYMFYGATNFNQPLDNWNVSNVTNMSYMFANATNFNQPLDNWNVSNVNAMSGMFDGITLSTPIYDSLLTEWGNLQLGSGLTFSGGSSRYCNSETARNNIITNYGWTIYDGGKDCGGGSGGGGSGGGGSGGGGSGGGGSGGGVVQTDFSLIKTLTTKSPITSGENVTYHLKIKNLGPNNSTYSGGIYDILPAEFEFISNSNSSVQCIDLGLAESIGDAYFTAKYTGYHVLSCIPVTGTDQLIIGQSIEFDIVGKAKANFILNKTKNRSIYFDAVNETDFAIKAGDQVGLNKDIFSLTDNNISNHIYSYNVNTNTPTTTSVNSSTSSQKKSPTTPSSKPTSNPFQNIDKKVEDTIASNYNNKKFAEQNNKVPVEINKIGFLPRVKAISVKVIVVSVPKIPYFLIICLFLMSIIYLLQAWIFYRILNDINNLILRLKNTIHSTRDFLSLTSHYLNTPMTIISGATEILLLQNNNIQSDVADNIKKYIYEIKKEINFALKSRNINIESLPNIDNLSFTNNLKDPIKSYTFWVPILISTFLFIIAQFLLYNSSLLRNSGLRITVEFIFYFITVILLIFSYKYRQYIKRRLEIKNHYVSTLNQLNEGQKRFLKLTSSNIYSNVKKLKDYSYNFANLEEGKSFLNGVDMLLSICDNTSKISKFSSPISEEASFNLSNLVNQIINKYSDQIKTKNIILDISVSPEVYLEANKEEIEQVIQSIIDNSIKFNEIGGKIEINMLTEKKNIKFQIVDTGIGINSEKLQSLFLPFSRATDVLEFNYEGIGLSLFISKIIVEKLGGKIYISNNSKKGISVNISLPIKQISFKDTSSNNIIHPTILQAQVDY